MGIALQLVRQLEQSFELMTAEYAYQLLELSTSITSMMFAGWFGMAVYYFQN
jgi:hypothetical protein